VGKPIEVLLYPADMKSDEFRDICETLGADPEGGRLALRVTAWVQLGIAATHYLQTGGGEPK